MNGWTREWTALDIFHDRDQVDEQGELVKHLDLKTEMNGKATLLVEKFHFQMRLKRFNVPPLILVRKIVFNLTQQLQIRKRKLKNV